MDWSFASDPITGRPFERNQSPAHSYTQVVNFLVPACERSFGNSFPPSLSMCPTAASPFPLALKRLKRIHLQPKKAIRCSQYRCPSQAARHIYAVPCGPLLTLHESGRPPLTRSTATVLVLCQRAAITSPNISLSAFGGGNGYRYANERHRCFRAT